MKRATVVLLLAIFSLVSATLMIGEMRQESATVDEASYLGGIYCFFKTGSYKFTEGHPILSQVIAAFPVAFFNLHESRTATAILEGRAVVPYTARWTGPVGPTRDLFPNGPDFYHWALPEIQLFAQYLIFDPANDADGVMFWGRMTQVVLTLIGGVLVFFFARRLSGDKAGLMAAILWLAHPIVLAYGHLILTDMSITLMYGVTIWVFVHFLRQPSRKTALWLGASMGVSFAMKFTALSLLPALSVLGLVYWLREKPSKKSPDWLQHMLRGIPFIALAGWAVIMIVYFPNWSPAPAIDAQRAELLGVPGWYQTLRPILIPKDFFKGITLLVGHVQGGGDSYLMGEWSQHGWWYYYPVAVVFKSPIPFLIALFVGLALVAVRVRRATFEQLVPWLAAAIYMGFAMTSKVNIGVRHVLPIFPLLAVGIADQWIRLQKKYHLAAWLLCGWLGITAIAAYPYQIQYFNELVGGRANGYQYLIDSNFDWGEDAMRLKAFLDREKIGHIYLDYFGTQASIEYLKIPNTRVNAETAQQVKDAYLVVSASELMRPEWNWLRETHQPIARVAYTLFVYQM